MIRACELRFRDWIEPKLAFVVGDVRDLKAFDTASFEFVLFAFNGIDSLLKHSDRLRAMGEIHRVCAPGGIFLFSTDNLLYARTTLMFRKIVHDLLLSERVSRNPLLLLSKPRLIVRTVGRHLRLRRINARGLRGHHGVYVYLRRRREISGSAYSDPEEMIEIEGFAIEPREQVRQLSTIGFEGTRILSPDGREVTHEADSQLRHWQWLYYVCRKPNG
jgi:SAM-dependent methyltransferase